jgi:hypothetical protein
MNFLKTSILLFISIFAISTFAQMPTMPAAPQLPPAPTLPKAPALPAAPKVPDVNKALQQQKDKVAGQVNAQVANATQFQVGAPMSNQLAAVAKIKKDTPTESRTMGRLIADCLKKSTDKDYTCTIKPEVEVRK